MQGGIFRPKVVETTISCSPESRKLELKVKKVRAESTLLNTTQDLDTPVSLEGQTGETDMGFTDI